MNKKIIIDTFTDLAPRYEATMNRELYTLWGVGYEDFVQTVVHLVDIRDGDLILDVATGTAKLPRAIASNGHPPCRIFGLDITPAMLHTGKAAVDAQELHTDIDLVCGSAMEIPFCDHVFDLITCGFGMHHMDVPSTLEQLGRKLKNGGRIMIVAVGASRLWRWPPVTLLLRVLTFLFFWLTEEKARGWSEAAAYSSIFDVNAWRSLLSNAGFEAVTIRPLLTGRRFWFPNAILLAATKGNFNDQCIRTASTG